MDSVRFSDFTVQRRTRRLRRGADEVAIGARAFDLLDLLAAAPDRRAGFREVRCSADFPGIVAGVDIRMDLIPPPHATEDARLA